MADRRRESPREQVLGEIPTCIVGVRYGRARPRPGQQVKLRREPENRHHKRAIRVEGQRSARIGYRTRPNGARLKNLDKRSISQSFRFSAGMGLIRTTFPRTMSTTTLP